VGTYTDGDSTGHGFLRTAAGAFNAFDVPNAGTSANEGTGALAINASGTIAGVYADSSSVLHGFIYTPALTATTTVLTSDTGTSIYGGPVTLTATVSATSGTVPDGETVYFMNGATQLGTGTLASGKASLYTTALPGGNDSITAVYDGDLNFAASTSAVLKQTVTPATSATVLASSSNPSTFEQLVTFTATVTAQLGGTPIGTVTFFNGSTALGSETLGGGVATFSYTQLPQGTSSITAVYNGNASLTGSTSNVVSQVVGDQVTGEWTWMGGSNSHDQVGVYGTLGVPASTNMPGSRNYASTWTDNNGYIWLFGGYIRPISSNFGLLNDLWKFNPSTDEWTWMGGNSSSISESGVYGTLGTPAATNIPGSRDATMRWTDNSGNLWLFGGYGYDSTGQKGLLNDLWKYTPSTGQWTWVSGGSTINSSTNGNPGVYGTVGIAADGQTPGSRAAGNTWVDNSGNLWLFGGSGVDASSNGGPLNDLWKFSISSNQWTWVSGSSTLSCNTSGACGQSGIYGTILTADATNVPGGREEATSWADSSNNLWLFGGNGRDGSGKSGYLNDLWEFSPSTGKWTWMNGSSTVNQPGARDAKAMAQNTATPGGRAVASGWTDSSGNFRLFGGEGYDAYGHTGYLDEFWTFYPSANRWATSLPNSTNPNYVGQPGVYGTLGTPDGANLPGSRLSAMSWTDNRGNLWLFGGLGVDANSSTGRLNDLWEYSPYPIAASPVFSVQAGTYVAAQSVTISDATTGATIYYTTDGTTPTTNSTVYSGPISVSSSETLAAIAAGNGYSTSAVATAPYVITLTAATPTFTPAAGTYTSVQSVTISDATVGATIYYTTDGTTPTTNSTVYSSPISVSSSKTLEAIAVASGYSTSAVATAPYVINIPTNPVPVIGSASPKYVTAGSAAFTLTISGTGFMTTSTAYWGSTALATAYVSASQLTASVTAAEIATAGTTAITVQNPTPGGGASNSWQFEVDSAASTTTAPTITSTTATITAGSTASYAVTVPSTVASVTVTCLNLPVGATCSYSSTTKAVTIATTSATPAGTYQITVVFTETVSGAASAGILLPILLLPLLFLRRKFAVRNILFTACLGLVLLAAATFANGCGGGGTTSSTPTHQSTSSGAVSLTVQ
jgi:N-acetylneuraminic acid mutarotase